MQSQDITRLFEVMLPSRTVETRRCYADYIQVQYMYLDTCVNAIYM